MDDDQEVLDGLKTTLLGMRAGWEMTFTATAKDALRKLDEREFDVIVTDLHMPDMNGFDLLTEVLRRHPGTVRIVLSATVREDLGIRSSNAAHQYLAKPCDAATLRTALNTASRIRELLLSPKLRSVISRITSLPSLPSVHAKLVESLANPEISSRELGEIIAQDVGMTAKVLQIANSAYFGLYRYIASPAEAAVYLGVDTIRALTMSAGVFSSFQHSGLPGVFIGQLQRHSMTTGMVAQAISVAEGLPKKTSDGSLVGGLLHDVGKLILAASWPKEYADVLAATSQEGVCSFDMEEQVFGATHADIGAYLLWLWGLPDAICNAVVFHHKPAECSDKAFTAAGAIHVADALERERSFSTDSGQRVELDMNYLTALGLADRVPEWRQICNRYAERAEA
ncbi:MAG: HDOD domain-containing protein [Acidobacteriia bacterium]|nr:HDOD domain-containing protein [Terriglobia bacterium]